MSDTSDSPNKTPSPTALEQKWQNQAKTPPEPSKPQPPKISKGAGCLTIIILCFVIGWIADEAGCNSNTAENSVQQQRLINDTAGPNNPVVQRINSLNVNNAYGAGIPDGANTFANSIQNASQMGGDLAENLQKLQDLKNAQFDLIGAQESVNHVNPDVLSEYRRGWNYGWNSHGPINE